MLLCHVMAHFGGSKRQPGLCVVTFPEVCVDEQNSVEKAAPLLFSDLWKDDTPKKAKERQTKTSSQVD